MCNWLFLAPLWALPSQVEVTNFITNYGAWGEYLALSKRLLTTALKAQRECFEANGGRFWNMTPGKTSSLAPGFASGCTVFSTLFLRKRQIWGRKEPFRKLLSNDPELLPVPELEEILFRGANWSTSICAPVVCSQHELPDLFALKIAQVNGLPRFYFPKGFLTAYELTTWQNFHIDFALAARFGASINHLSLI